MALNRIELIGHLGGDPEGRALNNGNRVVSFSMATSDSWRDKNTGERKEQTQWHRVVIFNEHLGKIAEQYLKKGARCFIAGKMKYRKFTTADGVEKQAAEVVLETYDGQIELLDRAQHEPPSEDSYGETKTRPAGAASSGGQPLAPIDDDIPF